MDSRLRATKLPGATEFVASTLTMAEHCVAYQILARVAASYGSFGTYSHWKMFAIYS